VLGGRALLAAVSCSCCSFCDIKKIHNTTGTAHCLASRTACAAFLTSSEMDRRCVSSCLPCARESRVSHRA